MTLLGFRGLLRVYADEESRALWGMGWVVGWPVRGEGMVRVGDAASERTQHSPGTPRAGIGTEGTGCGYHSGGFAAS